MIDRSGGERGADPLVPAIALDGVVRRYGRTVALDGLSLEVARGECCALLGPNGAGKTTLVELCEGYARPDRGRVRVLGLDPVADGSRLRWRLGIMLQAGGLYPALRVEEVLRLFGRFFAVPADPMGLLEAVGLGPRRRSRVKQLSGGERQRLSLAVALVGRPELCFLDEPTAGMDPTARHSTWELILALRRRATTVVLTTHDLEEAERLADRIAIVHHGRLVACDTPRALRGAGAESRLEVETAGPFDPGRLPRLPGLGRVIVTGPTTFTASTDSTAAAMASLAAWMRDAEVPCSSMRVGTRSLEAVFFALTGESLSAGDGGIGSPTEPAGVGREGGSG